MEQVDSVNVRTREGLVKRELEEFVDHFDLLGGHLAAVVVLHGLQTVDHRFKVD